MLNYLVSNQTLQDFGNINKISSTSPNWTLDTTKKYWYGVVMITGLKIDSKDGEVVGVDLTYKGKGELIKS